MDHHLSCPTCLATVTGGPEQLTCSEGHTYTTLALALATNGGTVTALWRAVRALEDDVAGLTHLAGQPGFESSRDRRLVEAGEAGEAAVRLRVQAQAAQQRLDALRGDA